MGRLTEQTSPSSYTGVTSVQSPGAARDGSASAYDAFGRVISITEANGDVTHRSYNQLATTVTDPKGNVTTTTSDPWGQTVSVAPSSGPGLAYQAESAGIPLIAVNPSNTTQACSGCGRIVPKGLSVRVHVCPDCGLVLGRDVNAARNILALALNNPLGRSGQPVTWAVAPCVG